MPSTSTRDDISKIINKLQRYGQETIEEPEIKGLPSVKRQHFPIQLQPTEDARIDIGIITYEIILRTSKDRLPMKMSLKVKVSL